MNHKIYCKSISISDDTGSQTLKYYISRNTAGGYTTYGVGIEVVDENSVQIKHEFIGDIFTSERKARHVLDNLHRRKIKPDELNDALEEIFSKDMQQLHPDSKDA